MSDTNKAAPDAAHPDPEAAPAAGQTVELRALSSFHEHANMKGRLLQAGDHFSTDRARAVELRANGLVAYTDEAAEKAAAADDPPPADNMGTVAITTRSIRRPRGGVA
jgi:hypothetical protein